MRNKIFWLVVFAVITITVLGVLFVTLDKDVSEKVIENPYFAEDYYILSEYNGKIAVFKNQERIPIDIYDIYVTTLPQHDRVLLENGIRIETPDELQKLIEDYTS
ncbi:MAG: BofC C-terminal domain-containing protein [Clostridia bacterium]|nr:BofC C-terminal domain-containing protein [Clostridia bacterium]